MSTNFPLMEEYKPNLYFLFSAVILWAILCGINEESVLEVILITLLFLLVGYSFVFAKWKGKKK